MSKATDISKINEHSPYYDMTPGNQIYGGGGSRKFCTGEWRTKTPVIDWENVHSVCSAHPSARIAVFR